LTAALPRLLIVDDEPYNRDLLERIFARVAEVVMAGGVAEALAVCEARPFEIVVTDQRLVRGKGTELAAQVRTRWPATRIVIITGFTDDEELVAARAAGVVDDVIGKPWMPARLRKRVMGGG
jgi:DNA-binding NtrC family response regulator